ARAALPSASRRAGSSASATTASASAAASPTGTRRPETPFSIASSAPTVVVETTGRPTAIASSVVCAIASRRELCTTTSMAARRPVRDHDAGVDRTPGEAVDPARPFQLVGGAQEEGDAAARAGRAPEGRHARRLLPLDDDDVGLLGPHRRADAEHPLRPRTADVGPHGNASARRRLEPRRAGPPEERRAVAARGEPGGGVDHPALDAAEAPAAVRVDEEEAHAAGAHCRRAPAPRQAWFDCAERVRTFARFQSAPGSSTVVFTDLASFVDRQAGNRRARCLSLRLSQSPGA